MKTTKKAESGQHKAGQLHHYPKSIVEAAKHDLKKFEEESRQSYFHRLEIDRKLNND
jgi:hypothetical protein